MHGLPCVWAVSNLSGLCTAATSYTFKHGTQRDQGYAETIRTVEALNQFRHRNTGDGDDGADSSSGGDALVIVLRMERHGSDGSQVSVRKYIAAECTVSTHVDIAKHNHPKRFFAPRGLAMDNQRNLYFSDKNFVNKVLTDGRRFRSVFIRVPCPLSSSPYLASFCCCCLMYVRLDQAMAREPSVHFRAGP
jgi:hypothetical protein